MFEVKKKVSVGDIVLYSPHKGYGRYYTMLVTFVGDDSLEGVVYAFNGYSTAASHKGGVRHESDPIWDDPMRVSAIIEDGDGGCFTLHPKAVLLNQLLDRVEELEQAASRGSAGSLDIAPPKRRKKSDEVATQAPPLMDQSFREPGVEAPEMTAEQKSQRAEALRAALSGISSD